MKSVDVHLSHIICVRHNGQHGVSRKTDRQVVWCTLSALMIDDNWPNSWPAQHCMRPVSATRQLNNRAPKSALDDHQLRGSTFYAVRVLMNSW